mgnify:CR=1 FL=1
MTGHAILQMGLYLAVLLLLAKPLGWYMARVYEGKPCGLGWAVGWLERLIYRICGIDPTEEMAWTTYAKAMLVLNLLGFGAVYALQRLQHLLPLNPEHLPAVPPDLAMNTAVSFATNTNWQNYVGETTLSYLTQMLGLTVQNFLSAATGMVIVETIALSTMVCNDLVMPVLLRVDSAARNLRLTPPDDRLRTARLPPSPPIEEQPYAPPPSLLQAAR